MVRRWIRGMRDRGRGGADPAGSAAPQKFAQPSFAVLLLLLAISCRGGETPSAPERAPTPARLSLDGVLGPVGDPALTQFPADHRFAPPFTVRGRRESPTLRWAYDPTAAPLDEESVRAVIRQAGEEWERTGVVTFEEVTVEADAAGATADVRIGWRRGDHEGCPPFLAGDGGLAHATDPAWPGEGFVHLNLEFRWSTETPPENSPSAEPQGIALRRPRFVDLRVVLIHELGHVLGLGHSADTSAIMAELYSDPRRASKPRAPKITAADAAGIHSLYGGGAAAASDLWVCSVDPQGVPHPVAPALRRVAPPGDVLWDVLDADGDLAGEIITWPARPSDDTLDPLGYGVCLYHFGSEALLVKAEGPVRGVIDPGRPLLMRDGTSRIAPGEIAYRLAGPHGERIARLRFSSDGLPLARSPEDRVPANPTWRTGASPDPRPLRDLDGDGKVEWLHGSAPAEDGRRGYRFGSKTRARGEATFWARSAIPADLDGDGVLELLVQDLRP